MKNVYLMTATQDQQLGYALDSAWYGMGEFTSEMRERFAKLRLADVNAAIRRHLSARDISIVIVTKDAKGLAERLKADGFSAVRYDAEKPKELLAEDRRIGAEKLDIQAGDVQITPVDEVFAR
jgi:zinc protease